MNAPRQGLFASLLILSFALHTFLLVLATTHQLNENRASQGQLMTSQLVTDSLTELSPPNTVSLALIANRYATNPSVASIRILDANQQVLATSGLSKTRQGEVFLRDALQNEAKVGTIEITLIRPSIGEILRTQWLAILVSFFIHALLWLAYRTIARPSRSEYLARVNNEARLKREIQQLSQTLDTERQNTAVLIAQAKQAPKVKAKPVPSTTTEAVSHDQSLALSVQFYDPKNLLATVNQSVSVPYFNLCQLFLDKSIQICTEHLNLDPKLIEKAKDIDANGAIITLPVDEPQAAECLLLIGAVFQMLSDVLYKRYREEKRFALQTRFAVASEVVAMQLNAQQAAARLASYLQAKESALYLNHQQLKEISDHYQLLAIANPSNALNRNAFLIQGMSQEYAAVAQQLRSEILLGKGNDANSTPN